MATITLQEPASNLDELIHRLSPGYEVVIPENDQPAAELVPAGRPRRSALAACRGQEVAGHKFNGNIQQLTITVGDPTSGS